MPETKQAERPENYNWEDHYTSGTTPPWDAGVAAPELVDFYNSLKDKPRMVFEIGCGTGTNAVWLAQQGASVVGTDIAPTAIKSAKEKVKAAGLEAKVKLDVLDVCTQDCVPDGSCDFVFDRGVFHVMHEELRPVFAAKAAKALKSGGHWLCLAGSKDEVRENPDQGPPQLSCVELLTHIEPLFYVEKIEKADFVLPSGTKHAAWVAVFRKR